MKKRLLLYTTLLLAVFSAFSCKKDTETTEIKPSIYGLEFELATFGRPGETFVLKPVGAFVAEGEGVKKFTYKWKVNSEEYQEMDTFTFKAEEVGNYTIYCQASDPDNNYYACTYSRTVIIIDPALGKTLTGTGIELWDDHIVDSRGKDGENEYYYTQIDELDWFRNNLAWTGEGLAFENADVTSYPLGRYYTWDEAMEACPEGWRLPTNEEWDFLGTDAAPLMCDAYLNSKRMWEYWPGVERTNTYALAIIPSGFALPAITTPRYKRLYDYAAFWTATVSEEDPDMAAYRYIHVTESEVRTTYAEKGSLALSVRCVRNHVD